MNIDFEKVQEALREKRQVECYGTTLKDFRANTFMTKWDDPNSLIMLSMSIQSDIQEMIARDLGKEEQRQYLNLSKYCLGEATRLLNKRK